MTYEEAIRTLKDMESVFKGDSTSQAVNMAIEALEKMTPTPPNWIYEDEPLCPNCGEVMDDGENPCECCNQLIDWRGW